MRTTMGTLLLMIALIFEIGFAIYCVATKENHANLKSWIRIAVFTAFAILTVSSVIVWSFRWVMLGILLLLLAIKGTVSLNRKKPYNKKYKTSAIVWKSIVMILAFVFALAPAVVFPQHKSPKLSGHYKVETAAYTYIDENRIEEFTDKGDNRFLNVEFWYPKNADYNLEVSDMNKKDIYTKEELYGAIQMWMKLRTDDMNFVIDTILQKAKSDNDIIYQHINTEKIGVSGTQWAGRLAFGWAENVMILVQLSILMPLSLVTLCIRKKSMIL
ncbi:hypothetical protein [Neobacillus notoginsengisoli]|uniref:hypothetical protein n=1 Tax=Neobacillus notoginsengisoli TaxID=1578198 RepID=UPI001F026832|nr:hypothetical protein [Neobacillus notoginsengisoli]